MGGAGQDGKVAADEISVMSALGIDATWERAAKRPQKGRICAQTRKNLGKGRRIVLKGTAMVEGSLAS